MIYITNSQLLHLRRTQRLLVMEAVESEQAFSQPTGVRVRHCRLERCRIGLRGQNFIFILVYVFNNLPFLFPDKSIIAIIYYFLAVPESIWTISCQQMGRNWSGTTFFKIILCQNQCLVQIKSTFFEILDHT